MLCLSQKTTILDYANEAAHSLTDNYRSQRRHYHLILPDAKSSVMKDFIFFPQSKRKYAFILYLFRHKYVENTLLLCNTDLYVSQFL